MAAPIGLSTVMSNMGELEFYHLLFTPFADMALFFLNHKKRQCNKYYNGVPNSKILLCFQMSKTFTLFTVYFGHNNPM